MSHARIFGKLPLLPVLLLSVLILTLTLAGLLAVGGIAQGAHPAARSGSPGTITVTKTGDTGGTCTATDCSLREAIKGAVSGDTVQVPAGTYTLTALFELTINKSLTLTGAGSGDTIIQAATGEGVADFRVFMITGDSTAAISRVTIRHGNSASSGGGIYNNSGTLTLTNSTLSGNSGGYGGGIYNGGTLTMTSSTVSNNNGPISISNKGAMTVTSSTVSNNSGGIFNTGILAVGNSTVSNNTGGGDGAGIRNDRGSVNLTDSKIINNTAHWDGGGIRNSGTLTVTNSAISGNTAGEEGGGIYSDRGTVTLIDSIVRSNISGEYRSAGGIYNSGGTLTLTRSAITGNSAPRSGGGIVNFGTVTLVNSTVSNSTASNNGGGIWSSRSLTLTNSTITGNAASNGGGIYNLAGTVSPLNSIIAGNAAPLRPDCRGVIASQGHNLIGDSSGCDFTAATGDLLGGSTNAIDPLLGPLQDNGGPTFTRALLSGSPSIDAGGDASCPATDQRGIPRPQGAHCDIGAFEFTGSVPPRAFDQTVTNVAATPLTIVLTASDPDTGDTLTFVIVSPPAGGDLFEGATATGGKITTDDPVLIGDTVTYKAGLGFAGTDTFEFKANDGTADGNVATVTIVVNEPIVKGAVVFEGMPNPISGARVTFSRDAAVQVLTSDPASGNFEMQLHPGIYAVTIEKDGFLKATKTGLVVNNDTVLTPARLLWGDADGNGIIDVKDVTVPAKNLGMKESPWE